MNNPMTANCVFSLQRYISPAERWSEQEKGTCSFWLAVARFLQHQAPCADFPLLCLVWSAYLPLFDSVVRSLSAGPCHEHVRVGPMAASPRRRAQVTRRCFPGYGPSSRGLKRGRAVWSLDMGYSALAKLLTEATRAAMRAPVLSSFPQGWRAGAVGAVRLAVVPCRRWGAYWQCPPSHWLL